MVSCEQTFVRDENPLLEFDNTNYPKLEEGYLYLGESITEQRLALKYKNGLGRNVEISMDTTFGVYAESFSTTLDQDEGYIILPLKGTPTEHGLHTLKVRITYGDFTLFCSKDVGVRNGSVPDVEMTEGNQTLKGSLISGFPASTTEFSFPYMNGWGRNAYVSFSCIEDEGLNSGPIAYELAPDGTTSTLIVPLPGKCTISGLITITASIFFEDDEENMYSYDFKDLEVLEPIIFEQETISHEQIITDRNRLMSNPESIETKVFTYKTVFVDMDGNGYVSGNHEIWLDRNLGATSTDVNSPESYGFYYQGSRNAPGYVHLSEKEVGPDTEKKMGTYYIGEKYGVNTMSWFNSLPASIANIPLVDENGMVIKKNGIIVNPTIPVQALKVGPNNPCPYGYRPPTKSEIDKLMAYLGQNPSSYTSSVLRLPLTGAYLGNETLVNAGAMGYYWGVAEKWVNIWSMQIEAKGVKIIKPHRAQARCIRCIKAKPEELATYE